MPILVKDFTWMQTDKTINIKVPLKPVYRENVDIFTTDSYIKVNFSPFLLELFLLHDVDNDSSKCIVNDDVIILDLFKKEEQEWDQLEKILTKPEKMKIKQEILEKCAEAAKQKSEDKRVKKTQLDRFAVQRAMDIDNIQHNLMDSRRNAEKDKAMSELEDWRQKNCNNKFYEMTICKGNNAKSSVEITELKSDDEEEKKVKEYKMVQDVKNRIKTKQARTPTKTPVKSEYVNKMREEVNKRVIPKPRQAGVVEIQHTARSFPTPSRESTANEEEAWLKNITLARRATGFVSEDLRPEEQDPQWCKEKGDEFFRNGNFLGAVSAYTHGITLSDKLPSLFSNRAATHYALGNFNKCVNDCSTALDLMKPPCEGNRRSRAKCIARRAAALARLGYLNKAIDEMKAAAKLLPDDENIKKDVYDMERAWEQNPDSD